MEKKENYQYLLRLYSLVDEYLANIPKKQENLPEVVVAFCIVTEKIFKIRLHKKNSVLVYENAKIKEDDSLVAVIKECESISMETIKIRETINRYKLIFCGEFSDDEMQVLVDIYNIRNHFLHGYKPDEDILSDKEDIVKKMGTVWEKISAQAVAAFGKNLIKTKRPKEKYSKKELEKVLVDQVRKKIESYKITNSSYLDFYTAPQVLSYENIINRGGEKCPRCGTYGFSMSGQNTGGFIRMSTIDLCQASVSSDLYKCNRCNLELTEKEYEIAKKLKSDELSEKPNLPNKLSM